MVQIRQEVLNKLNDRQVITRLAYEFNRDLRTIKRWIKDNDPMLTTPMSVRAIAEELKVNEGEILTEVAA